MAPTRLISGYSTAVSHRITHWITSPFAMVRMHRYLSIAPQLLLANKPYSPASGSIRRPHSVAAAESTSAACQVHTSALSLQQQQQQHQDLLSEKQIPFVAAAEPKPILATDTATDSGTATNPAHKSAPGPAVAFNYLLAASWHPKSRSSIRTAASSASDPSDENGRKWWKQKLRVGKVDAGEDAFFHVSTPSRVALGVADGVGGWAEVGVDPALFSWALMDNAESVARLTDIDIDHADPKNAQVAKKIPLDAQSILDGAYSELVQSGKVEAGSSTACILSLCKMTGTLRASNLGDSAYLLIRDNKCIYESPSQQHFWNCPYQLTVLPPGYPGAGQHVMDTPKDAAQTTHQLQDGDVIVLATDGFWDNVFTKEAIELVDRELGDIIQQSKDRNKVANGENLTPYGSDSDIVGRVRALSQRLTNTARRFSLDQKRVSPFSQGARHIRSGGKVDDITVIVTLVRALGNNSDHA
ncbi:Protein phosphatase PTC7 [Mortierella sp. AD011]|nr:Protein phosphatase PTC7 [Mortierella sp. AD010]KAF9397026.1 Protein phosphatase PTC7 [Mortierella sp. AD011]